VVGRWFAGCLAVSAAALAAAGSAWAVPQVSFTARSLAIAGSPNTGNIAGAGEAVELEFGISGTEYGGFPPALTELSLHLPGGTTFDPSAFPTCPDSTLEPAGKGPKACERARAGPTGSAEGYVAFGTQIVPETATVEPFYAPGGRIDFFMFGHEPVLLEILSKGEAVRSLGESSGPGLNFPVPFLETVPGEQVASFKSLRFTLGSAAAEPGETDYSLRAPISCPKGYEPYEASVVFAGVGGLRQLALAREYRAPCPQGSLAEVPLAGTEGIVTAPSNKTCVSKRDFRIHIVHIPHLLYQLVTVEVNGKPVEVLHGRRASAQIDLKGLPRGTYVARIGVITTSGRLITGTRTYHTCAAHAIRPTRPPKL
jgi:hypothetical protein